MMIRSNSSTSVSRPLVVMVNTISCDPSVGAWPIFPAANWAFCSLSARSRSLVASFNCAIRSGRSQMRMA